MSTYYKVVRPDGTSFHDPSFRWLPEDGMIPEEGHVVTHPLDGKRLIPGLALTYLSVATKPTECTGMEWPCRLLVVEPAGREVRRTNLPHKRASTRWRVVRELPATDAFEPQGEHVVALIERASHLTGDEARKLDAAWDAARGAAWDAAWDARDAAWDAARDAARGAAWDAARVATWVAAGDAAADAAAALVARDTISTAHYDALTRPWASVIGKVHPDDWHGRCADTTT